MFRCDGVWVYSETRMIQRPELIEAFEQEWQRQQPLDYQQNLRIADALYELARALGVLPLKDPLDGIEVKIRLAKALNSVKEVPKAQTDDESASD